MTTDTLKSSEMICFLAKNLQAGSFSYFCLNQHVSVCESHQNPRKFRGLTSGRWVLFSKKRCPKKQLLGPHLHVPGRAKLHLAELRSRDCWVQLQKVSKHLMLHPLDWQRLLQDSLDPKTNLIKGPLLDQLLSLYSSSRRLGRQRPACPKLWP